MDVGIGIDIGIAKAILYNQEKKAIGQAEPILLYHWRYVYFDLIWSYSNLIYIARIKITKTDQIWSDDYYYDYYYHSNIIKMMIMMMMNISTGDADAECFWWWINSWILIPLDNNAKLGSFHFNNNSHYYCYINKTKQVILALEIIIIIIKKCSIKFYLFALVNVVCVWWNVNCMSC